MAKQTATAEPSGALIRISDSYPVLAPGSEAATLMRENMAGDDVGIGDLDRIKVPAGGGTTWEVPSWDGAKAMSSLEGIILHVTRRRAYWKSADPSGDPPDCSSSDCINGVGDPGGACESCPLNQFGSSQRNGKAGRGKACKETAIAFLLMPGQNLPVAIIVPPGSLKVFKQHRLKLPVAYYACTHKITLKKEKNRDGIGYAQIAWQMTGQLNVEEVDRVKTLASSLREAFDKVVVDSDDVSTEE